MQEFEASGTWWLPEAPDKQVPGRLVVSDAGRAELILIGALRDRLHGGVTTVTSGQTRVDITVKSQRLAGQYPRILGQAGSVPYTLTDCFRTHRSGSLLGGLHSEKILANQVFQGAHLPPDEPPVFQQASVELDWLPYWVMVTGIEESIITRGAEDAILTTDNTTYTLSVHGLPDQTCKGADGTTIRLRQSFGQGGDGVIESRLTQAFDLTVAVPDVTDWNDLLAQLSDLQDLVTVGSGRRAAFKSISFRHPDLSLRPGTPGYEQVIKLFAQWQVTSEAGSSPLRYEEMLFSLTDLGGMPGVERWLEVARRNRSALSRVMATNASPHMFVSDRVLNCIAALESYDRDKHADKRNLIDRLRRSAAHAGQTFTDLVGDVSAWTSGARDARNDVAHHNARMEQGSRDQLLMGKAAFFLFVLCLLRDAKAPPLVFDRIAGSQDYGWLRASLAERS